ncbi:vacuolar protein sorting-associated protein 9A-like [Dorcoceras hygrometricum]|uniref:Vacuolar protein sorting-associated protein 9A-like n=1 Tax=Dorcoceras hygrometricum TaxID=472368 RepID=A0A2Z7BM68_9LAMI|nr:vacuolar protein sorting-associated protein 9A-like [Dorcoceras hygrometricum]
MENSDVFGSSTAPLTWHDFLERMRQPTAAEFVKAIKSFIVSFLNNAPDAERDSASVQEFLNNMEAAFRAHSLWAGSSEEELESAGEGLEKYVMTKLFTRVYASIPEDVKADDQLHEKMALLQQFVRPENLDIKPKFQNEASWLLAQKELLKINMYKAPRDKLLCILHCCKVINNLLINVSVASSEDHPGADEFLPVLIYVTIKANPPQLHSNLSYIQRFRRQTRLVSEAAYFFTNMLSVESFIMNLDAKALSMEEMEYETNMESARALLSGLSESSDNSYSQADRNFGHVPRGEPLEFKAVPNSRKIQLSATQPQSQVQSSETGLRNAEPLGKDQLSLDKFPSISELENKGATMLFKEHGISQTFHDFPYFFAVAGDLTVSDVENLLNNYKQLVLKYVCLAKGLGVAAPSPPNISKESEKTNDLKDVSRLVNDLGEGSVSEFENIEPKLPGEETLQTQGERGDENSLR